MATASHGTVRECDDDGRDIVSVARVLGLPPLPCLVDQLHAGALPRQNTSGAAEAG